LTRSCSRARSKQDERGFAIVSALVLAFLFFSLVGLILLESAAAAQQASRFRSRAVADALAESAAEIGVMRMLTSGGSSMTMTVEGGEMAAEWEVKQTSDPNVRRFILAAQGKTKGVPPVEREVQLAGRIFYGNQVTIDRTLHGR
jgi:hypothetical protein